MSELKRCPFCGDKAEQYAPIERFPYITGCSNLLCYVAINKKSMNYGCEGYSCQEEADNEWNARHVPEGMMLVPSDPTEAMNKAVFDYMRGGDPCGGKTANGIYKAMLKAAKGE